MDAVILEREAELAALAGAARDAAEGAGTVVLICGEAGIGKSSLVESIGGLLPAGTRLLAGYCDDLATPRVLGPFRDLIGSVGGQLSRALERGDRAEVLEGLRAEFGPAGRPAVLVVEDVHAADEASVDALRYLVRRLAGWPLALVLTYREEELDGGHPLRRLLGLIAGVERARRLRPAPLSVAAVRRLAAAAATRADPGEVHAVTGGNPYFVAEVLAAGDAAGLPPTIADAVLARVERLDAASLEVVRRLAVVPSPVPYWLVEALAPDGSTALARAERRGLITVTPGAVSFRHELARRAVVAAMPVAQQVAAHRGVLAALLARPEAEASRVVHHAAWQAGDTAAVLAYGPVAARRRSRPGRTARRRRTCGGCSACARRSIRGTRPTCGRPWRSRTTPSTPRPATRWRPSGGRSSCGAAGMRAPSGTPCGGCRASAGGQETPKPRTRRPGRPSPSRRRRARPGRWPRRSATRRICTR
ncbi:AAA family ATPase [Actinomadura sp. ATCC 31491]|uniref:AAA family ATPase n=1 Tax=Actinomadura luzonensis TaxID=2805427 RepID=A0ABT0G2J5_9ACTN|nr:AAA family ATPase [Actinomadura luzonensis]MCK2218338.1 AAA family ATPase [Actinomadura luzonensis]